MQHVVLITSRDTSSITVSTITTQGSHLKLFSGALTVLLVQETVATKEGEGTMSQKAINEGHLFCKHPFTLRRF